MRLYLHHTTAKPRLVSVVPSASRPLTLSAMSPSSTDMTASTLIRVSASCSAVRVRAATSDSSSSSSYERAAEPWRDKRGGKGGG